ncbi:MAG: bi-domain-containing oxidoreductase [Alphaproteobacteria bacterium]|nr:bi-domain-containing oxidoreductase [Alphaproteobacteria bacterium]
MPRPAVEQGAILVRVQYSLISSGTELAGLRPSATSPAGTAGERATELSNRALYYLGKAAADPGRAARKIASMTRSAVVRRIPRRAAPPQPPILVGPLEWQRDRAAAFTFESGRLSLKTDDSAAHYQAHSQILTIPTGRIVELSVAGSLSAGAVAIGLLNHDRSSWIGLFTLEDGAFSETFRFDPAGSPTATVVIANAGAGSSGLVLEKAEIALFEPDSSGLPVSEMEEQGWGVGYSVAGEVVAIGEGVQDISPGDLVACAGAGQANHADYVSVKRNLVCRVPTGCALDLAATTTVGAIALQGVRRAAPGVGEIVCVIGLGLIGMITVELLKASGCTVIGLDRDPDRVERARSGGVLAAGNADELRRLIRDMTGGHGADRTILTAATKSSEPTNLAMEVTRRRGRVVLVGDVGLSLERPAFYRKELDLVMSTSYGPGRYDRGYEDEGRDYPYSYVRWTLNRNMRSYMELIAAERIDIRKLIDRVAPITQAPAVYRELAGSSRAAPLGVLFEYPEDERNLPQPADALRIVLRGHVAPKRDRINYALVGVGGFGTGMLVPQMDKRKDLFCLRGAVSRDAVRGGNFARTRRLSVVASELSEILRDPDFDLVVIATRHHEHAGQAVAALRAGKHVFVEKPLALTWPELDAVRHCWDELPDPKPLLMVGFNRRFSPAVQTLATALARRRSPCMISYRLNGGFIPAESWVQGREGGGRNIGEACHMYDVFRSLAGAPVTSIAAKSIDPGSLPYGRNDNFVATLGYGDGSVAELIYTALGPKEGLAKERIEVFCDGEAYILDDYKNLTRASTGEVLWQGSTDKGHFEELSRFGQAIATGGASPIPLDEIIETSAVALHVEDLLFGRAAGCA